MRCGLVAGLVISLPLAVFQFLSFIRPAFETKKTFAKGIAFVLMGLLMFALGVCFAVFILLPFCLQFFFSLGVSANIQGMVSLEQFLTLYLTLTGCLGIAFETPMLIIMLAKFDIASPKSLGKARPIVIIIIFIVSAVITPPDIVSQCMVAIPMWLLYEMGLLIARVSTRKKKEKKPRKQKRVKRTRQTKRKRRRKL